MAFKSKLSSFYEVVLNIVGRISSTVLRLSLIETFLIAVFLYSLVGANNLIRQNTQAVIDQMRTAYLHKD